MYRRKFKQKNIVQFYGVCEKPSPDNKWMDYYAVLEKMDGSLSNYTPNPDQLQHIFISVAEGIHVLHQEEYTHRDICAENILVNPQIITFN